MAWDASKPGGGDTFPPSDDAIRDNWTYLAAALQEISSFAANPSDPTLTQLKLDTGVLASRPATGVTGQVYFATDTGQLFVYNAAWVEITRLGSALTLAGAVSMLSTLTTTGLITANGGITLAAGQKLTVPSENYLRKGAIDLEVHNHQGRHGLMTAGTAGVEFDYLAALPKSLLTPSLTGITTTVDTAVRSQYSFQLDTTNRRIDGRALIHALLWLNDTGTTDILQCFLTETLNGAIGTALPRSRRIGQMQTSGSGTLPADAGASLEIIVLVTGISAGLHTYYFNTQTDGITLTSDTTKGHVTIIDFGPAA